MSLFPPRTCFPGYQPRVPRQATLPQSPKSRNWRRRPATISR
jgi:hypothetical protein